MDVPSINPRELEGLIRRGETVELIDVRTPFEFNEVHAGSARLVPLDGLDPAQVLASRAGKIDQPLYVICRSGGRGKQAVERFRLVGCSIAVNVEGGMQAWESAGLPVVRGKKGMSLERQVRIAAGTLVVLGVALGTLVHPGFFGLSAFVGAWLVFAGITDTCGMGLMLARMPWNRRGEADPSWPPDRREP